MINLPRAASPDSAREPNHALLASALGAPSTPSNFPIPSTCSVCALNLLLAMCDAQSGDKKNWSVRYADRAGA